MNGDMMYAKPETYRSRVPSVSVLPGRRRSPARAGRRPAAPDDSKLLSHHMRVGGRGTAMMTSASEGHEERHEERHEEWLRGVKRATRWQAPWERAAV